MSLPADGPCQPWADWDAVKRCASTELQAQLDTIDGTTQAELLMETTEVLYLLDGARLPGECEVTRSICRACATCSWGRCSCSSRDSLDLGGGVWSIGEVSAVVVAGVTLAPSAYAVRHWRWLVRMDGGSWPSITDVDDPDQFTVTYTYGVAVPAAAVRAVATLVLEQAKACLGLKCQIPERVTQIQREGVSYTIIDSMKMLDEGKTGFYVADRWLAARKYARRHGAPAMTDPASRQVQYAVDTGAPPPGP